MVILIRPTSNVGRRSFTSQSILFYPEILWLITFELQFCFCHLFRKSSFHFLSLPEVNPSSRPYIESFLSFEQLSFLFWYSYNQCHLVKPTHEWSLENSIVYWYHLNYQNQNCRSCSMHPSECLASKSFGQSSSGQLLFDSFICLISAVEGRAPYISSPSTVASYFFVYHLLLNLLHWGDWIAGTRLVVSSCTMIRTCDRSNSPSSSQPGFLHCILP